MNKQIEDIKAIREMMERSSKFLSLSGLSGIVAGVFAIAGAAFAYFFLLRDPSLTDFTRIQEVMILLADAIVVLLLSVGFGVYFSWRKAKKNKQKIVTRATLLTLYNFAIPLIAGGIFSIIYLFQGDIRMVISATLVFYGLALVSASKYTLEEVHYLGLTEIALGLVAALFHRYGILFWTIGFGFCHIFYGLAMYIKYDLKGK